MKSTFIISLGAIAGGVVGGCSPKTQSDSGSDIARFTTCDQDSLVRLEDDFYQWSNGGWIKQHPIPAEKSRYGVFDILYDESEKNLHDIVEEVSKSKPEPNSPADKIGTLYALGMDTTTRNAQGLSSIESILTLCDQMNFDNSAEFATSLATLHIQVASPFFAFFVSPDGDNSTMNIAHLWQSGLGLPDRDYYFSEDALGQSIIDSYKEMIGKYMALLGQNDTEMANKIFNFEKKLAEVMNTKVENRDPVGTNNKTTLEGLKKTAPRFDWDAYFAKLVNVEISDINISQPRYMSKVFDVIAAEDPAVISNYLKYNTLRAFSSFLTSETEQIAFDFYSKKLSGVTEMRPLWKRTLSIVDGCMGEELGKLYVERFFPASSKVKMQELIEQLRISFNERIGELTWMSDSTKAAARDKLASISVKVGYPDKWKDYSSLTIDKNASFVQNIISTNIFDHQQDIDELYKEVDKTKWHMTPQTVNAYYNPSGNEIVFPAAILQPPFFYANGDDAVNYGAIGVVIGHEMTHGFDDKGCMFDKNGNISNWWTEEDNDKFRAITHKLEERFSNLVVIDSIKGNGALTLGENIADLGGLNIAHQAFINATKGKEQPMIDGQSAEQRFLLGYSRVWASDIRPEAIRRQVMTDPHSIGRLRVNGQLPLLDFFYTTYNIKEGDGMFLPESERIVIW